MHLRSSLPVVVVCLIASALYAAAAAGVHGRIVDRDGLPLPGVVVTATADDGHASSVTADASGEFALMLVPGHYRIRAELQGFETIERDVLVRDTIVSLDITLPLAGFSTVVTVSTEAPKTLVGDPAADAPVIATRDVVDSAMLPNSQYDDVLPLMPNVVRGPDGQISVAGARAPQGALIVNGVNQTDPTTGEALLMLPLESVDSLQVYQGGYPATFGRAASGVTSVVTRSGGDKVHASANSFFPRLLIDNGGIQGVAYWEPNAGVSGPIVRGRAYFEQGVSYRFDRNLFTTLAGPQRNSYDALMSWSQIDLQPSPLQHIVISAAANPQSTDRAGITAFTTAESAPRLDQRGWSGSVADRLTIGNRQMLEVRVSTVDTRTATQPNGPGGYELAHDATGGSYYDALTLNGRRTEVGVSSSIVLSGAHTMSYGTTVGRETIDGSDTSTYVHLLHSDGSAARLVQFGPAAPAIDASTFEASAFVQDEWTAASWLTVNGGARVDRIGAAASATVSPRAAFTIRPSGGRTTISGSAGRFSDKLVLATLAFPSLPARTVTTYDASGVPADSIAYRNAIGVPLRTPVAFRWDLQIDREFGDRLTARVKYAERHGSDELVVTPDVQTAASGVLTLDNGGVSDARSLEATVGYRASASGHQVYASYVRSAVRGNLNSFDAISGVFGEPFVQPDQIGPLPADVPNRLLLWGVLHAPARFTIAPFLETRSGFPYSVIADDWSYVGARNSARLPWFASLDLYVNKIIGLPGHLPDARVGLKLYNIASAHTERDVQRDIARPEFGTTYNPIPRDFSMVFELLWR